MKPHNWVIEEIDGGSLGVNGVWVCSECGASGGPEWPGQDKISDWIFLADGKNLVSGLQLPLDCDEAKAVIAGHYEKTNH